MIEATVRTVGNEQFTTMRLLEPDRTRYGMPVHYVYDGLLRDNPDLDRWLRGLGLKRVGYEPDCRSYLYTEWFPHLVMKILGSMAKIYWAVVRWLYFNARAFQPIPSGEVFSWKVFTPYVWGKEIWTRLRKTG